MKKSDVAGVAVTLLVGLAACEDGLVSTQAVTPSLMVAIGFADARPQTVPPADRVVIVLSGPESRQLNAIPGDTIRIDRLQAGTYTVRAEGWAGSFLAWLDDTVVTVRAGATVTAQIDDVPFEVEPPQSSSPDTIVFGDSISLSWSPHPRATSYLVEWSTSSAFDGVVDVATTTSTSIAIDLGGLGAYHLRVSPMEGTNRGPPTPFARSIVVAAPVLLPNELCTDFPSFAIATFDDSGLEAAIRAALNVGAEDDLTCGLLSSLSVLTAREKQISVLTGIQNLTGLDTLNLGRNLIVDVSPMAALTGLISLVLDQNSIADIGPVAGLATLTSIILNRNSIANISPLAELRRPHVVASRPDIDQ